MPGKCKFQDSWLSKDAFKDWLLKDVNDIHFARCKACGRSIKLLTMGEAALTSHAGGAGHKAALRRMLEGNFINEVGQMNGSINQEEDSKEQVAISLQREARDRISGAEWSDYRHGPTTMSTSPNAEMLGGTFPTAYFIPSGSSRFIDQRFQQADIETEDDSNHFTHHDTLDLTRLEHQQQMKMTEWENRMKVLMLEQELVREKRKAVRQKEKAYRMKKTYYKAKLKRLGEHVPLSSSSSADEEEKVTDVSG